METLVGASAGAIAVITLAGFITLPVIFNGISGKSRKH